MREKLLQIHIRVTRMFLARLDALLEAERQAGRAITRADLIREMLEEGLPKRCRSIRNG